MPRIALGLEYDGTDFVGWQIQRTGRSVEGVLAAAVSQVAGEPVKVHGSGRTDAGVHGWGQVVSGDIPDTTDLAGLQRRINKLCGPAIAVRNAEWTTDPEFSARFSAEWRHYRYHVLNSPTPDPFLAGTAWHVIQPLNLWAMQLAADPFIGEHDFSSFCRRPKPAPASTPPSAAENSTE